MTPANGGSDTTGETEGETDELALVALFLGIFWIFGFGSIAGIVLGLKSERRIRNSGGELSGRSIALGGVAAGVVGLLGSAFVIIIALTV